MRILHAIGGSAVQDLNKRYRQVPPFGRGVICRFMGNPSSMLKLATRDFEDLLQVWIPWLPDDVAYHIHTVRPPSLRGSTPHAERKHLTEDTPV